VDHFLPTILFRPGFHLTVGSKFGAAYEIYAHGAVASAKRNERAAARDHCCESPPGIAYDMAAALLGGGVLASPIWESPLAAFGNEGAREISTLSGTTASFP
jgi:4-carboxymuconolactone decarboxylase